MDAAAGRQLRLVVGGGSARGFPKLGLGDVSLNIDPDSLPDVLGDINRAPFAPGTFATVYLEKVPYHAFSGQNVRAIEEMARVLQWGGRLVIETGNLAPLDEIVPALRGAGFRYVRITDKGYLRITARRGGR